MFRSGWGRDSSGRGGVKGGRECDKGSGEGEEEGGAEDGVEGGGECNKGSKSGGEGKE